MITKTTITITHAEGRDVDIKIDFQPSVKAKGPLSPAHALGAEFLEFITERNKVTRASASLGGKAISPNLEKEGA